MLLQALREDTLLAYVVALRDLLEYRRVHFAHEDRSATSKRLKEVVHTLSQAVQALCDEGESSLEKEERDRINFTKCTDILFLHNPLSRKMIRECIRKSTRFENDTVTETFRSLADKCYDEILLKSLNSAI